MKQAGTPPDPGPARSTPAADAFDPELEHLLSEIRRLVQSRRERTLPDSPQRAGGSWTYGAFARAIVQSRAAIGLFFEPRLFGDPAFDLLLELYASEEENRQVLTTHCAYAARVPETTSLRWLAQLEREELIVRARDPVDARRNIVRLTPAARNAVLAYLQHVSAMHAPR